MNQYYCWYLQCLWFQIAGKLKKTQTHSSGFFKANAYDDSHGSIYTADLLMLCLFSLFD